MQHLTFVVLEICLATRGRAIHVATISPVVWVGRAGRLCPGNSESISSAISKRVVALFDYVRRAMPFQESKSLPGDELYAVSAYTLNLNGIVGTNDVLDAQSLPKVGMPNREGFIPFPRNPK
jgi:hypothetical protein